MNKRVLFNAAWAAFYALLSVVLVAAFLVAEHPVGRGACLLLAMYAVALSLAVGSKARRIHLGWQN